MHAKKSCTHRELYSILHGKHSLRSLSCSLSVCVCVCALIYIVGQWTHLDYTFEYIHYIELFFFYFVVVVVVFVTSEMSEIIFVMHTQTNDCFWDSYIGGCCYWFGLVGLRTNQSTLGQITFCHYFALFVALECFSAVRGWEVKAILWQDICVSFHTHTCVST